jgi:predicted GNAT superfamily acetyltransferase
MSSEAWRLAEEAARAAGVTLRPLDRLEDADAINRVIAATWGTQHLDREILVALATSGNVPWGACDGDEVVGYVLGWLGLDTEDGLHLHSHMLATLPDRRHRGVGAALKLAQRAQALDRGVRVVRWTFDPLVARNAWFNLVKLGAIADRFHEDFYGAMDDEINVGDRTDRLVVRWDLEAMTPGTREPVGFPVLDRTGDDERPRPSELRSPGTTPALVRIPREYHRLRTGAPELGAEWRAAVGSALRSCFEAGLRVTGFTADTAYVLT